MKNKFIIVLSALCSICLQTTAQTTLEFCYAAAKRNYPLIKQYNLIEQTKNYTIKNIITTSYPQGGVSAKATYQSDVTSVPIPGIKSLSKDQYQIVAEVDQSVWDGGVKRSQKDIAEASFETENRNLDVDMYTLEERVNSLFFGVLMFDQQLNMNTLLEQELARNLQKVESYVTGGIANGADIDAVKVEILSNKQNRVALESSRAAYIKMLSIMVGQEISSLVTPPAPVLDININSRPEMSLFTARIAEAESQKTAVFVKNMPKIGVFVQGAYGNPGLDMLKAGFTPYAIGGIRLSWNFGSLYTKRNDLAKIELQKSMIGLQRDVFLFNTDITVTQIYGEINRLKEQIRDDKEIVTLRGNIKRSAQERVAGGTMSVTDMLREVTAENSAMVSTTLHEVELLMNLYVVKNKGGL